MTKEDLRQHAAAWDYAVEYFSELEMRMSVGSQHEMTVHMRRLAQVVAIGYRVVSETAKD